MIKLFRKIRQQLLTEKRFSKYMLYAIGEIVLVVIGILIALSINNWNENQKKKKQLDAIYSIIEQNLKTDLKNINVPIVFYERLDSTLNSILTTTYPTTFLDSINEKNFLECIPCKSNHHTFESFEIQDNGIELLKKYEDEESIKESGFSQEIIQLYTKQGKILNSFTEIVADKAFSNFESLEQFPWFSAYSLKHYNRDAIAYFLNDQSYKNKVATFRALTCRNYLVRLKEYEKTAKEIITKFEKRREGIE